VLGLEDGRLDLYPIDSGVHAAPRFTPDGSGIVFVFDNPRQPGDLWLLYLANGSVKQLTRSLPVDLQAVAFAMPERVRYASLDGTPVPALLFRPPPSAGPPPGVVLVHGGPNWLFQYLWYPLMQHLASRDWAVLAPNYRGSTGYGRAWELASRFDYGGVDAMDVAAGADFLIREGLADPARIAVSGRSHGGYLTMVALTRYPERWAAGSAVVPFLNWFTAHANSREDLQHWDLENFGDPVRDAARWRERSPLFSLDRVRAPVQLICGAHDPRCPAEESIAARDALAALGKPVDFALYPDEGHAFLKRENVIAAEVRRAEFLARWLEEKP
jgi:dipeptidyl aminopeptidase/acylaminoacyl peptidase